MNLAQIVGWSGFRCYLLHKLLTISFCQMFLESKQNHELQLQQTVGTNTIWDLLYTFFIIHILYICEYKHSKSVWHHMLENNGLINHAVHERKIIYFMILKLITNTCLESSCCKVLWALLFLLVLYEIPTVCATKLPRPDSHYWAKGDYRHIS